MTQVPDPNLPNLLENIPNSSVLQTSLEKDSWNFDRPEVEALRRKIFGKGKPLKDVVGSPLYGIKTGLNEAFIIDKATKDRLIKEEWELRQKKIQSFACQTDNTTYNHQSNQNIPDDGLSSTNHPLIKPFLVGRDLKQWHYEENGRYLIAIQKGYTREWAGNPKLVDEEEAWEIYSARYPAIANYHKQFEDKAKKRQDQGDFWWELRACDYYKAFEEPKIVYPEFMIHPKFIQDISKKYFNNKVYFIASNSFALSAILSSRLIWFIIKKNCAVKLGEVYELFTIYVENFLIVEPPGSEDDPSTPKGKLSSLAKLCQDSAFERYKLRKDFLEIVGDQVRQGMSADDRKKLDPESEDVSEGSAINKWDTVIWDDLLRMAQSPSAFGKPFKDYTKNPINTLKLKRVYQELAPKCHELTARIHEAEMEINQIVYKLYDLTPDEIELLKEQTGNIYED